MSVWFLREQVAGKRVWYLKGRVIVKRYFSYKDKKSSMFEKVIVLCENYNDSEFFSVIEGKPEINYLYDDNNKRYLKSYEIGKCKHEWVINYIKGKSEYISHNWEFPDGETSIADVDYGLHLCLETRVKRNDLWELYYEYGKDINDEDFFEWMLERNWQLFYTDFVFTGNLLMAHEYDTLKNTPPIVPKRSGYGKI